MKEMICARECRILYGGWSCLDDEVFADLLQRGDRLTAEVESGVADEKTHIIERKPISELRCVLDQTD